MKKNTGKPYEILTQHIFNDIVNQDSVNTITVKNNVILKGKTIEHQIDVYWEFEVGGVTYYTIVQAKDWDTAVNQGELLKFKGVLDDLPNQPRGIFVTRTGYQRGAKEFAEQQGILLYELREPNEKDWEGKVKTIIFKMHGFFPDSKITNIEIDTDWLFQEKKNLGISDDDLNDFVVSLPTDEMYLYNENKTQIGTVYDTINAFFPIGFKELEPTVKKYNFVEPTLLSTQEVKLPFIKINSIEASISVSKVINEIKLERQDMVSFILKNVIDDSVQYFNKDLKSLK